MKYFIFIALLFSIPSFGDQSSAFEVTKHLTMTRLSDGGLVELPGDQGYKAEIYNEVGPIYYVAVFDREGKRVPGVMTVAKEDFDPIVTNAISSALRSFSAPITNDGCGVAPEPKANPIHDMLESIQPQFAAPAPATNQDPRMARACKHYQEFLQKGVPADALKQALAAYINPPRDPETGKQASFANSQFVSIADYSQRSTDKRFYLLDLDAGTVSKEKVSHGGGLNNRGDPDHNGYLRACSANGSRTNFTRVGIFQVSDYYYSDSHQGKWPNLAPGKNGMRLRGLSPTNNESMARGVVMHEALYNQGSIMGRSWGCPAFPPGKGAPLIKQMRGGSLFYGYSGKSVCQNEMKQVLNQVPKWESTCSGAVQQAPILAKQNPAPKKQDKQDLDTVAGPVKAVPPKAVPPKSTPVKVIPKVEDQTIGTQPFASGDGLADPDFFDGAKQPAAKAPVKQIRREPAAEEEDVPAPVKKPKPQTKKKRNPRKAPKQEQQESWVPWERPGFSP